MVQLHCASPRLAATQTAPSRPPPVYRAASCFTDPALCHFLMPKVFSMPYFLLISFFFTSSLTSGSSSFLFFSLALYSPLLFMVKSLLDPDEIKRRVLMFIGWKKVHIVPERREFN
jgi:hypothetical protein